MSRLLNLKGLLNINQTYQASSRLPQNKNFLRSFWTKIPNPKPYLAKITKPPIVHQMIYVAGISIAFFISALLLIKKNKSRSDLFLLLWMILNALHLTFFYLQFSETIYNYPMFLGVKFPFPLLHGVLLYCYVASVTNQFPKNKNIVFLHLIPAVVVYLYLIPFFSLPAEQKIYVFQNEGVGYETFLSVLLITVFISGIVYVIWASKLLINHKKNIRDQFSNIEEVNLKWLQFLTIGLGLVWVLVIFTQNDTFIFTGVSVFVILIGFFGIQQKEIFTNEKNVLPELAFENNQVHVEQNDQKQLILNTKTEAKPIEKAKYSNSGLTEELKEENYQKLMSLVTQEKVYTNCDLSLKELATQLKIHPNYLSQIINEKEEKNFYDFINTFRVNEFKRLIVGPKSQQFTILGLAYDCGFNSKSSFNRNFKKITGTTPSQFIQANQQK